MAETEVESILREIRERVLTQERTGLGAAASAARTVAEDPALDDTRVAAYGDRQTPTVNLALINSYLTTTARAWDRLPPVVSNRSGLVARLELWCKRSLKRATRWYAWEQVNFNAAVHHALRDLLPVLSAYEHELERLRAEIDAAHDRRQGETEQLRTEVAALRAELTARRAENRAALQAQSDLAAARNSQLENQLRGLLSELRERDEQLHAEQRVSFKQLSLEAGEAATLAERARRQTETLVAKLQCRLDEIAKKSNE